MTTQLLAEFDSWLTAVRDRVAKARIAQRLDAAVVGHFGDCEPVGEGVSEMRIHVGAGYRVYFARRGELVSASLRWREGEPAARH